MKHSFNIEVQALQNNMYVRTFQLQPDFLTVRTPIKEKKR